MCVNLRILSLEGNKKSGQDSPNYHILPQAMLRQIRKTNIWEEKRMQKGEIKEDVILRYMHIAWETCMISKIVLSAVVLGFS